MEVSWAETHLQIIRHRMVDSLPDGISLSGLKRAKESLGADVVHHMGQEGRGLIDVYMKDAIEALNGQLPYRRD